MTILLSMKSFSYLLLLIIFLFLKIPLKADTIQGNFFYYTVKQNNQLPFLIKTYHTSQSELLKYNSAKTLKKLLPNSIVKIPLKGKKILPYVIKNGDSLTALGKYYIIPLETLQQILPQKITKNMWVGSIIYLPFPKKTPPLAAKKTSISKPLPLKKKNTNNHFITYTIRKGDTFFSLAHSFNIPLENLKKYYPHKTLIAKTTMQIPVSEIEKYAKPLPIPPVNSKQIMLKNNSSSSEKKSPSPPITLISPIAGKRGESYSPLVPGKVFAVFQRTILKSPISGKVNAIKSFFGFGNAIFIENAGTTLILASKGFDIYFVKKRSSISQGSKLVRIQANYPFYLFCIRDGKLINP